MLLLEKEVKYQLRGLDFAFINGGEKTYGLEGFGLVSSLPLSIAGNLLPFIV